MTEMFGEAWPPMSVPDLAPDDDDDDIYNREKMLSLIKIKKRVKTCIFAFISVHSFLEKDISENKCIKFY